MFSRATEYAIRALGFLALQPPGKLSGAREIAEAEELPIPFLWKLLRILSRRGLIRSFKGAGGGYELARPAGQIRLERIVFAIETVPAFEQCVLGLEQCNDAHPCSLHQFWKKHKTVMRALLKQKTLADLVPPKRKR